MVVPIATWEITSNDDPFMSISLSIYCAGCDKSCPGCHSPALQDKANGKPMNYYKIIDIITQRVDLIESVVFLGGEWTLYMSDLEDISYACKMFEKKTILYTGHKIIDLSQRVLDYFDIIIDGEYREELKTNYKVPVSSNQTVYIKHYQDPLFKINEYQVGYHVPVHPSQLPINRET